MLGLLLFLWLFGCVGLAIGVAAKVTTLKQIHHLYVGTLLLLLAGAAYPFVSPWVAWTLVTLGALLALDDGTEHATAAFEGSAAKAWSPIHTYLMPVLYRTSWFPPIEAWLDRLCGKPQTPAAPPPPPAAS